MTSDLRPYQSTAIDRLIITRKAAKAFGQKFYYTGKPCKRGHVCERWVSGCDCVECEKTRREANRERCASYKKSWQEANREKHAASSKAYYEANREKCAASVKAWQDANSEKFTAMTKAYRKANPEKVAARNKAWKEANPDKRASYEAMRRAAKLNATPPWLTDEQKHEMEDKYFEAQTRRGGPWHVDHQVPLAQGGLHVPWNLEVISAEKNTSKGVKILDEHANSVAFPDAFRGAVV